MIINTSKDQNTRDYILRILLLIAVCFAIGSIGLFLAVLMQNSNKQPTSKIQSDDATLIQQKKDVAMHSLSASERPVASTSITTRTSATSTPRAIKASPTQADQNDSNATTKLNILEGLNAK